TWSRGACRDKSIRRRTRARAGRVRPASTIRCGDARLASPPRPEPTRTTRDFLSYPPATPARRRAPRRGSSPRARESGRRGPCSCCNENIPAAAGTQRPLAPTPRNANAQALGGLGVLNRALAMTYFLTGNPQYQRRGVVSRSCSGWEGVGPTRYGRQEFWKEGRWPSAAWPWTVHCTVSCDRAIAMHGYRKVIESSRTGN